MDGEVAHPMVASADIGETAARWLARTDWTGIEAIQLLGPADLSYNEVGKILSEKSGRPIRYTRLAANEYRESLLQIGYQQSAANALIAPTTFKSWARDNLSPLLK